MCNVHSILLLLFEIKQTIDFAIKISKIKALKNKCLSVA